jgi:predicted dehydrogenase
MAVRIGLIGSGNISATHAKAVAEIPDATVVAVYGPTLERAQALADRSGAEAFDVLDDFFDAAPLDMVAIGSPSGLHGEHGAAAARKGIHVLVEKPLEISVARAGALIDAARRAGVVLGVVFQDRMKPDIRGLKHRLDAGEFGAVRVVRADVPWWRPPEYYRGSRWRGTWALDGGGALMNQGVHTVDLLLWLCGPIVRVFSRTATLCHDIEVEDTVVAVLEFANGALGTLAATTCAYPGRPRRIEIAGSRTSAVLIGDHLDGESSAPENSSSPVVSDVSAHRAVFADFIRALTTGSPPACSGEDGRRSVDVIEAIYASARTGRPVDVSSRTSA